ncbi:peroxidase-related enzyme [Acidovorax sp. GBBC 3334]|uniref:CMD domain-containing protein n=1 Tax=Acidovorax sp. GBBC 3334 TaxID=2940496 RepID=UPI0023031F88|nr:peroxidase-related enzyme [Acidovorax sp. GBBC 3334]MDA8456029.1 peroxidase-related enzyme [Acidovorax sp. GBBC 3334]
MTTQPSATAAAPASDTIDHVAGLVPGRSAHTVRHQRDKVATATQACEDALFSGVLPGAFTPAERLAIAQDVVRVSGVPALAAHYRARLEAAGSPVAPALRALADDTGAAPDTAGIAGFGGASARLQAAVRFARTLALEPARSDRDALLALPQAGLSTPDAVLIAQLVGFVTYQLRVAAGVAALDALPAPDASAPASPAAPEVPFVHPANLPPPGQPLRLAGYTSETLDWKAWLPVVDPQQATEEQQAVLDLSHPKARTSDFYLLLAHQPRVLSERSQAFNAIMYAPGGLARAEREVASTVVSRVNGCVYCASVHAQRFEQLAKRNDVMAQIFEDPDTAGTNARERAIVQASAALTRTPGAFGPQHLAPLRAAGLSDLEILDALHAAALFAWANRLMLNLGEAVYPAAA